MADLKRSWKTDQGMNIPPEEAGYIYSASCRNRNHTDINTYFLTSPIVCGVGALVDADKAWVSLKKLSSFLDRERQEKPQTVQAKTFIFCLRFLFPMSLHSVKFLLNWLIKHFSWSIFLLFVEDVRSKLLFLWYLYLKNDKNSPRGELLSSSCYFLKDITALQNIPCSFCDELWALTTTITQCWRFSNALVFFHMFNSWWVCWFAS